MFCRSEAQLNQSEADRRYALLFLAWPGSACNHETPLVSDWALKPLFLIGRCGHFSGPVLSLVMPLGRQAGRRPSISPWFDCFLRFLVSMLGLAPADRTHTVGKLWANDIVSALFPLLISTPCGSSSVLVRNNDDTSSDGTTTWKN